MDGSGVRDNRLLLPRRGGTISIAGGSSCTNSSYNAVIQVGYYNATQYWHCASANSSAAGTGIALIAEACAYGDPPSNSVLTGTYALGVYSYARGTNGDASSRSGWYGIRTWAP